MCTSDTEASVTDLVPARGRRDENELWRRIRIVAANEGADPDDDDDSRAAIKRRVVTRLCEALNQADSQELAGEFELQNPDNLWTGAVYDIKNLGLPQSPCSTAMVMLAGAWEGTGGLSHGPGIAIHLSTAAVFGVALSALPRGPARDEADRLYDQFGSLLRSYIEEQYRETQRLLQGLSSAVLFHGTVVSRAGRGVIAEEMLPLQPLNSFSIDPSAARCFPMYHGPSEGECYAVYAVEVPRNRIASIPSAGIGSYGEREVVVLGPAIGQTDSGWRSEGEEDRRVALSEEQWWSLIHEA